MFIKFKIMYYDNKMMHIILIIQEKDNKADLSCKRDKNNKCVYVYLIVECVTRNTS